MAIVGNEISIWKTETLPIPVEASKADEIVPWARQLSKRDQQQILTGFASQNFEMAMSYVWTKSMAALKRELGSVGMSFIGEMLGRHDLNNEDDPIKEISDGEAIRLAEQLGVISSTGGVRLRNAFELVAHFQQLETEAEADTAQMEQAEAVAALKACVANILGREKIKVAQEFSKFRSDLESVTLNKDDQAIQTLLYSPYFYRKLSIDILCSVVRTGQGANLEHALANLNTILPLLWESLHEPEKWSIGSTYSLIHNEGKETATAGVKKALLKVKGFDYVPETLRSNTYIAAAEKLVKVHESMNNFYNEDGPTKELVKLGTTIPTPALSVCLSALLSVFMGNRYGRSFSAAPVAEEMLNKISQDRWNFFLNKCLPTDVRLLWKLQEDSPINNFCALAEKLSFHEQEVSNSRINQLLKAVKEKNVEKVKKSAATILNEYFNKNS